MFEIVQRFFDKFDKSEGGSINQEEFMKALAEERNLVDILTQNGRCYQGMELWRNNSVSTFNTDSSSFIGSWMLATNKCLLFQANFHRWDN